MIGHGGSFIAYIPEASIVTGRTMNPEKHTKPDKAPQKQNQLKYPVSRAFILPEPLYLEP